MTTAASHPEGVTIRHVERADLLEIARIERASFPQPWPFQAFEQFLDEPGFLVAVHDTAVIGYVVADAVPTYGRAVGHVKDFAVHPEWRNRGIGTQLLDRALFTLASHGANRVKLEVRESNRDAIALYEQFEFDAHRRIPRYYEDGEDALILVTDLADRGE